MSAPIAPLLVLALLSAAPDPSAPTCRSIDGHVACGYGCKSDGRYVRCARTPQGRCKLVDGQAVCFDPPAYVVRAYGGSPPEPECKAIDGEVACGYACTTYMGRVKCASTPAGVCRGKANTVECFDPPAAVFAVYGAETPRAECKGQGQDSRCGYRCTSSAEGIRCANTPLGVCKSENGRVTCFDPSPGALCSWGKALPAPQCRSNDGTPVCGYACTTAYAKSACASTPKGVCQVFDSEVHCFDPPSTLQAEAACMALLGLAALEGATP